jgi:hypothetical protein
MKTGEPQGKSPRALTRKRSVRRERDPIATPRHTVEFIAMTACLRFEKVIDHLDQF